MDTDSMVRRKNDGGIPKLGQDEFKQFPVKTVEMHLHLWWQTVFLKGTLRITKLWFCEFLNCLTIRGFIMYRKFAELPICRKLLQFWIIESAVIASCENLQGIKLKNNHFFFCIFLIFVGV